MRIVEAGSLFSSSFSNENLVSFDVNKEEDLLVEHEEKEIPYEEAHLYFDTE